MSHLPELTPEQTKLLREVEKNLKELEIRPRDLAKYLGRLAMDASESSPDHSKDLVETAQ